MGNIRHLAITALLTGCGVYSTVKPDTIPVQSEEVPLEDQLRESNFLIQYLEEILAKKKISHTAEDAMRAISTPRGVRSYLGTFGTLEERGFFIPGIISFSEQGNSARDVITAKKGLCWDYSVAAAGLLQDDGYMPHILIMNYAPTRTHSVFIYRTEQGWTYIGNNLSHEVTKEKNEDKEIPYFDSLPDLVASFAMRYPDNPQMRFTDYRVIRLDEFPGWLDSDDIDLYHRIPLR
ncbi:TPA: hypothetical protein HA278_07805 [Candidatus Woesearchaeota archaeon]|nr:hypothetical protein [archaeon]HIJ11936.1 hypothetical protein [Candidatus Woesearchaeota archaeon]|tara:strand:- start:408 stop:1112 length:705 start_codon:yes stop_codon:yes gene_type:complete